MFRNKDLVFVFGGEHLSSIKPHSNSCYMRSHLLCRRCIISAIFSLTKFGIENIPLVTIWKAEVHSLFCSTIQFIIRDIVSQVISAIISKPQFLRLWIPVKSYCVANTTGKNFPAKSNTTISRRHRRKCSAHRSAFLRTASAAWNSANCSRVSARSPTTSRSSARCIRA